MKKIITIAFMGMLGVMTLGSCYKKRNCECVTVYNPEKSTGGPETKNFTVKGFKSGSKATCEAGNSSDSYTTITCKLTK